MMKMKNEVSKYKIAVWDVPTRVFHWLFAISFLIAMMTEGDSRYLHIHVYAGYTFFGLLIFRLIWGFWGTYYARFSSFNYSWENVKQYLLTLFSNKRERFIGHNPAGSWAIFSLLTIAFLISLSGLTALAGEEGHGPLVGMVTFELAVLSHIVHEILSWSMLLLVVIHIFGVIIESGLHNENLLAAMISGYKKTSHLAKHVKFRTSLGACVALVVFGFSFYSLKGYVNATEQTPYLPYQGPKLVQSDSWNEACGDCHMPYHPSLLPAVIWEKMFADQNNHFDEDLYLDDSEIQELEEFAINNSSERLETEASRFITHTTPESFTSLRITDTPYWKKEHADIPRGIWNTGVVNSVSECDACHFDALKGTFQDGAMRLPKPKRVDQEPKLAWLSLSND